MIKSDKTKKGFSAFHDFNFWRKLINFWSLLFFFFIIYDFFTPLTSGNTLEILSTVYIGVLAIYVGDKEFERWYNKHQSKHPGEIFVIIWTVLIFALIFFGTIFKEAYKLPGAVVSAYIAVLTILVITSKSKQLYKTRNKKS